MNPKKLHPFDLYILCRDNCIQLPYTTRGSIVEICGNKYYITTEVAPVTKEIY